MVVAEVEEILLKYKGQEEKIETFLRQKDSTKSGFSSSDFGGIQPLKLSMEETKNRNTQILKELEFVKGKLRSKAIFSPTEFQWEKLCQEYQNNPSLPVTTWHCHQPVFV